MSRHLPSLTERKYAALDLLQLRSRLFEKLRQLDELVGLRVQVEIQKVAESIPLICDWSSDVECHLVVFGDVFACEPDARILVSGLERDWDLEFALREPDHGVIECHGEFRVALKVILAVPLAAFVVQSSLTSQTISPRD
jgi:hypothetical protein